MAVREKSIFVSNEIYFITFTILGWQNIFINDKYRQFAYNWFDYMKRELDNEINGYCIMPNHLHSLIKISDKSPGISQLIQSAKRIMGFEIRDQLKLDNKQDLLQFFAKHADKKKGAKYKIFEDRYDSLLIQSEKFFLEKLNYIHNNPCQPKWQLAENPEDYVDSSAANYILGKGKYEVDLVDF